MTLIHRLVNKIGLEVRWLKNIEAARDRENNIKREQYLLPWKTLVQHEIETVIDVGANNGQFATHIRELLPKAFIWSFEPLPDVFRELQDHFSQDPLFKVFPYALSDKEGQTNIHRSTFSPSSSLLQMGELHKKEFPFSSEHSTISVELRTLDGLYREGLIRPNQRMLVKIDVQGHEDAVIRGARHVISLAHLVFIEVSFVSLYDGQPLFGEIHDLMKSLGFVYRGNIDQYFSPNLKSFLFADAIFVNTNISNH